MSTLFVGLGRMGAPMARRHADRFDTVLLDADPAVAAALADELGCRALPTSAELPGDVDTVVLMLPDSRVVEAVLLTDGLLDRLPSGALVIDMGSSEPASTQRLAAEARARGTGYVDAPVSGGVARAVTGELSIMVGGDPADVERARPHLEPLGGSVTVVGAAGAGHAAKALNNLLSATNLAAAAEVLTVAAGFGIAPEVMVEVLNTSTGRSQATEVKYPKHVLTGSYDSGFAMDLMIKDLGIARSLAAAQQASIPVTDAAYAAALGAREALGGAGLDHTEIARHYESVNRTSLRSGTGDRQARPTTDDEEIP
ncbi:NAD(P)-dependent oxidoreductase [Blastococcus sp. VKM Ac-2987]|uniref:NAD(P)-dependent oxidoreductase n=1 Tax=Blastococcus sp. VKM Ac-2987 TaxID=3004141 RepID=UPI0022AB9078|nr:NAD(P)-dependent oxidoreductase [Blastococcus sp. VKM Ac-2987]MCZ2860104.1 NAD(P)-dependent oxidoreductase [Blastococcus sp. VKM Ac-2987]